MKSSDFYFVPHFDERGFRRASPRAFTLNYDTTVYPSSSSLPFSSLIGLGIG